ncbi:MAG: LuxR C-terminal-related transcriptional regulator [Nevskia sp.]|nr:LuxR C-terminal-related transcriptional regulator [Nevskia sp.]
MFRQRLMALDRGQPVLVAEAPSGYGKTVLARDWLARAPEGVRRAWVILDEGTRDPAVFLDRIASALTGKAHTRDEAFPDDEATRAGRFTPIAELLTESEETWWIVFDDAHTLAGSSARTYLRRLLLGAGPNLRCFIAMQPVAIDVGLGDLTTQNRVCWINAGALALTRSEIEGLTRLRQYEVDSQQIDWLIRATQGWPALVQLALATPPDRGLLMPNSIGRLGPVREYIYERFLSRLEPHERDLLWVVACVGSCPVPLLKTLAKLSGDPEVALHRLFNIGIAQHSGEESVNIHPLVSDAVLRILSPERAQTKSQLQSSAADWYWRHGQGVAAVRLLMEAGAEHLDKARDWLFELSQELIFSDGQHQTTLDLIEQWEFAANSTDPSLDRSATWALIFQRRFAEAHARLKRSSTASGPSEDDEAQLQLAVIAALSDDYASAGKMTSEWLETHASKSTFLSSIAWTVYGFQLKCVGDADEAMKLLQKAHEGFRQAESGFGTAWAFVVGALALVKIGGYRNALAEVERGVERCGSAAGLSGQRAMLRSVESFIRYERNELNAVRDILDEGLPLLPEQGSADVIILGFSAAARLRAATGDLGAALDILSEGERCGADRGFPRLVLSLQAERALLLLRCGASGQALQVAEAAGLILDDSSDGLRRDRAVRLHARLALADGDTGTTLELLLPLLEHARESGQRYKLCELLIVKALADDLAKNHQAGCDAISEALGIASTENFVRVFIDEGQETVGVLRRWIKANAQAPRLRRELAWAETIVAAADDLNVAAAGTGPIPLQPLNKRERQILSLVDQGLSNAEIAARCFVVEGTVKWNLHNLYGKLGVKNRTAALRIAREHNLIPNRQN